MSDATYNQLREQALAIITHTLDEVLLEAEDWIDAGHTERPFLDYIKECANGERIFSPSSFNVFMWEGID